MWIDTGNRNTEHWLRLATQSSTVLQLCSIIKHLLLVEICF